MLKRARTPPTRRAEALPRAHQQQRSTTTSLHKFRRCSPRHLRDAPPPADRSLAGPKEREKPLTTTKRQPSNGCPSKNPNDGPLIPPDGARRLTARAQKRAMQGLALLLVAAAAQGAAVDPQRLKLQQWRARQRMWRQREAVQREAEPWRFSPRPSVDPTPRPTPAPSTLKPTRRPTSARGRVRRAAHWSRFVE